MWVAHTDKCRSRSLLGNLSIHLILMTCDIDMSPFIGEGTRGLAWDHTAYKERSGLSPAVRGHTRPPRSVAGPTGQLRPINPREAAVLWGGLERWFQALWQSVGVTVTNSHTPGGLSNRILFPHGWEAGSPRSGCWGIWCFLRLLPSAHRRPPPRSGLAWSFPVHMHPWCVPVCPHFFSSDGAGHIGLGSTKGLILTESPLRGPCL